MLSFGEKTKAVLEILEEMHRSIQYQERGKLRNGQGL
jgi:hypothetical protein